MKEQGINTTYIQFRGFWAPQDFPAYAVKFWEEVFAKIVKTQGFKEYLKTTLGMESFLGAQEFKNLSIKYVQETLKDIQELDVYKEKNQEL